MSSSDQYLRKCSLIVSTGGDGLDLSQLRIVFKTRQSDVQTPNTAIIRVYNLSDHTAQSVQKEFTAVRLQAGYETGAFGTIFDGTIKQVRRGRENPTDTYLDILAGDGDKAYNQAVISKSMAAGYTDKDELDALVQSMGLPPGYIADMTPGAGQRGQVLYGLARDHMRNLADRNGMTWSIQNGQVQMIPNTGYKPGTAVVLNSNTGMIGLPEQTEGGILVRSLLNPNIKIGCLLQIDNASIQQDLFGGKFLNAPGRLENLKGVKPKITSDGFYKTYVAEFEGDTRGEPWYCDMTCLAVDKSAPANSSVKAPA